MDLRSRITSIVNQAVDEAFLSREESDTDDAASLAGSVVNAALAPIWKLLPDLTAKPTVEEVAEQIAEAIAPVQEDAEECCIVVKQQIAGILDELNALEHYIQQQSQADLERMRIAIRQQMLTAMQPRGLL
jgi:hypothetical protein